MLGIGVVREQPQLPLFVGMEFTALEEINIEIYSY